MRPPRAHQLWPGLGAAEGRWRYPRVCDAMAEEEALPVAARGRASRARSENEEERALDGVGVLRNETVVQYRGRKVGLTSGIEAGPLHKFIIGKPTKNVFDDKLLLLRSHLGLASTEIGR